MPKTLFAKCADAGWLAGVVGAPWREEFAGSKLAGGIKPSEFDAFHEMYEQNDNNDSDARTATTVASISC